MNRRTADPSQVDNHLAIVVKATTRQMRMNARRRTNRGRGRHQVQNRPSRQSGWQLRANAADHLVLICSPADLCYNAHNANAGARARIEVALMAVSDGDFGASGGGHSRSPVGHAGEPEHGVEPQQEDLRQDRDLAEPPHRRRASVPLSRRQRDKRRPRVNSALSAPRLFHVAVIKSLLCRCGTGNAPHSVVPPSRICLTLGGSAA